MTELILTSAAVEIAASEGAKLPRVSILAYSGDVMTVPGFGPIVVDLAGMSFGGEIPLLADHANSIGAIVGQGTPSIRSGQLHIDGTANTTTDAAKQIVELAKSGHKFQASIGATPLESRRIDAGKTIQVNGRSIKAESSFLLVTKSILREVTICALGCDANTSVQIAAKRKLTMPQTIEPKIRAFIIELGSNPDTITPENLIKFECAYAGMPPPPPVIKAGLAGEAERIAEIQALQAEPDIAAFNPQHEAIVAGLKQKGIAEGWHATRVETEILRASRPQCHTVYQSRGAGTGPQHLSAALMVRAGFETAAIAAFGEQIMQQSRRLHGQSLPDLCRAALMIDGREVPSARHEMIRAGLSTGSMPVALGDSANRVLFEAYRTAPASWRSFAATKSAANFKTQRGVRPTFAGDLTQLAPGGEIKHGSYGEDTYTWTVDTFAKMFSIDRRDIVNDDLSCFSDVIPGLARAAMRTLNGLVATTFMDNAAFFTSGRANAFDGAGSPLQASSLATAIKMLRLMKDAEGNLLDLQPSVLLVPPELEQTALALLNSTEVARVATGDNLPTGNTFKAIAKLVVEPRLSDSAYTGYSATAWYLFSDPMNAAVVVGFLDGMQSPTLESFGLDHDVNKLALSFRVYHDFGCALADFRAAIRSKGAA